MTSSSDRREEQTEIIITAQNAGKRLDAVLAAETEVFQKLSARNSLKRASVKKRGSCDQRKKVQRVTVSWWKSRLRNGWK